MCNVQSFNAYKDQAGVAVMNVSLPPHLEFMMAKLFPLHAVAVWPSINCAMLLNHFIYFKWHPVPLSRVMRLCQADSGQQQSVVYGLEGSEVPGRASGSNAPCCHQFKIQDTDVAGQQRLAIWTQHYRLLWGCRKWSHLAIPWPLRKAIWLHLFSHP